MAQNQFSYLKWLCLAVLCRFNASDKKIENVLPPGWFIVNLFEIVSLVIVQALLLRASLFMNSDIFPLPNLSHDRLSLWAFTLLGHRSLGQITQTGCTSLINFKLRVWLMVQVHSCIAVYEFLMYFADAPIFLCSLMYSVTVIHFLVLAWYLAVVMMFSHTNCNLRRLVDLN